MQKTSSFSFIKLTFILFVTGTILSQNHVKKEVDFPHRGQVYLVHLDPTVGTEMQKTRPCIVLSSDESNQYSTRVIVVPLTSKAEKYFKFAVPTHVANKKGQALPDQIRTVDRNRLIKLIGICDKETMQKISKLLLHILALEAPHLNCTPLSMRAAECANLCAT